MGFDSLIRSGVALANSLTSTLQVPISYSAWIGQSADGEGTAIYASTTNPLAVVEYKDDLRQAPDGRFVQTVAHITFPYPLPPNGAPNRNEPLDPKDKIVLPNGATGPLVGVNNGVVDPTTNMGYLSECWIGVGG